MDAYFNPLDLAGFSATASISRFMDQWVQCGASEEVLRECLNYALAQWKQWVRLTRKLEGVDRQNGNWRLFVKKGIVWGSVWRVF